MTRIEFFDDDLEFGHLVYYDADHNDPPAELLPATLSWLKANLPGTKVDYGDIGMSVVLEFASREALTDFRTTWGRGPASASLEDASDGAGRGTQA